MNEEDLTFAECQSHFRYHANRAAADPTASDTPELKQVHATLANSYATMALAIVAKDEPA